jgi:hypothetical protein
LYWFSMKRGLLLFRSNPATIIIISTDPVVEETPRAARKFSPFKELNVINATIAIIDSGFASVHRRVMDIRLIIMLLLVKSFNERNVLPTCNLETFALFRIVDFWLIRTYINFTVKQFSENGKCLIAQGIFCSFVQRFCVTVELTGNVKCILATLTQISPHIHLFHFTGYFLPLTPTCCTKNVPRATARFSFFSF